MKYPSKFELIAAITCVLVGLCVAVAISPKNTFFLQNVAFYWGSQLCVIVCMLPFKPRPAIVAGSAISLAIYLALFNAWLTSQQHPESLAWLGYIFSLPGAVVAGIAVVLWHRRLQSMNAVKTSLTAAVVTATGIAINQTIICSTLLHCKGGGVFSTLSMVAP